MRNIAPIAALYFATALLPTSLAHAQSAAELAKDGQNTDNVLTYGMGYSQHHAIPGSDQRNALMSFDKPIKRLPSRAFA